MLNEIGLALVAQASADPEAFESSMELFVHGSPPATEVQTGGGLKRSVSFVDEIPGADLARSNSDTEEIAAEIEGMKIAVSF